MPSRNHELPLHAELERTREETSLYDAIAVAVRDPHAILDVLLQAEGPEEARSLLQARFGFTEIQARAVLDLQFFRVSQVARKRIEDHREELVAHRAYLENLQSDEQA